MSIWQKEKVYYVDTVAGMLSLTGVKDGTRVNTARYSTSHTVGDGSGGEYVYDADSTATVNDITILPGIGGAIGGSDGTGRWQRLDPSSQVATIADLDHEANRPDGYIVRVASFDALTNEGGGLWRWVAGSAENGTQVILRAGTGGQWIRIIDGPITPEMFGAYGDGVADDTAAVQSWASFIASSKNSEFWEFAAPNAYRVTDTIMFGNVHNTRFSIGQYSLDSVNSLNFAKRPGIWYDGTGGTGPEPQNCKPALWFQSINFCKIDVICVYQYQQGGTAANYTTGMLVSNGGSSQSGNTSVGELNISSFRRGLVLGLANNPGGLIGHTGIYSDDVFEEWSIGKLNLTACVDALYISARTSDGSVIHHANVTTYLPTKTFNLGGTTACLDFNQSGYIQLGQLQVAHHTFGDVVHVVDATDISGNTITVASHGLSNDDPVFLTRAAYFGELSYVANATANTFEIVDSEGVNVDLSTVTGGAQLIIARQTEDQYSILVDDSSLDIDSATIEVSYARIQYKSATQSRRNKTLHNLRTSELSYDINGLAARFSSNMVLGSCAFYGDVEYFRRIHATHIELQNGKKLIYTGSGSSYSSVGSVEYFVNASNHSTRGVAALTMTEMHGYGTSRIPSATPYTILHSPLTFASTDIISNEIVKANATSNVKYVGIVSTSTYPTGTAANLAYDVFFQDATKVVLGQRGTSRNVTVGVDNVVSDGSHPFSNGDIVVFGAAEMPGGLEERTQYYIIDSTTGTYKISATPGGSEIDITSTGSGVAVQQITQRSISGGAASMKLLQLTPVGYIEMNTTSHYIHALKLEGSMKEGTTTGGGGLVAINALAHVNGTTMTTAVSDTNLSVGNLLNTHVFFQLENLAGKKRINVFIGQDQSSGWPKTFVTDVLLSSQVGSYAADNYSAVLGVTPMYGWHWISP